MTINLNQLLMCPRQLLQAASTRNFAKPLDQKHMKSGKTSVFKFFSYTNSYLLGDLLIMLTKAKSKKNIKLTTTVMKLKSLYHDTSTMEEVNRSQ